MNRLSSSESVIHKQFVEYGRNAREWTRKCSLLLPDIAGRRIWKKRGFGSIYEYAAKLAGMSRHSVDSALWVLRKVEDLPELKRVVEEKGVSRVRPIANLATAEDQGLWAEKARTMSKPALEAFAHEFRKSNREDFCPRAKIELREDLVDRLRKLENLEEKLEKFLDFEEARMREEKPDSLETKSRHIPVAIKSFVVKKSGGCCAFPGCKRPYEILHHTQRWALEKVHDPDRLVPLCKAHEQLVHLGLIENEQSAPEKWRVRMRPDRNAPEFWVDEHVALFRGG